MSSFTFRNLLLYIATLLIWLLYLLGVAASYLPSPVPWWMNLAGLAFPYLFFGMLVLIMVWIPVRGKMALISAVLLISGWKGVVHTWAWHWRNKPVNGENGFTIMSYNVNNFKSAVSAWLHWREDFDRILYFHNADIICLQEFATVDLYQQNEKNNVLHYTTLLQKPYAYFTNDFQWATPYGYTWYFGNMILSKFPFADTGKIILDSSRHTTLAYADLVIGADTIRVMTAHLQSFGLEQEEMQGIKNSDPQSSWQALRKLRKGFQLHERQALVIARVIRQSPYPVILCGDFNTTPVSGAYFTISRHLQDAFLATGAGLGRTYSRYAPTLRIDYIFADPRLEVKGFEVIKLPASDHYPILASIDHQSGGS
ncbi:endonuclease/exonuclease/phosphatase family protein [Thermoflavifilum thermophilum]|uniref:Metal-dependent hydrolase, endonuclease/exonuclease/phosphatase family n=1 Tax=Thermoflavifilum thermophilum TaxID=1393122 RepID=A0A1I7N7F4_9BACT|nr:endonuclease/exonuclease/phosphatase family protein [Thermoflavifilum thermophilum]SFV30600.1 Metal-dependent hydrolase, endonuclease/exonuclease/phosphatase family [Thermoflavifilum thermophilum]